MDGVAYMKIRKTQIMDIKFVLEISEHQYYRHQSYFKMNAKDHQVCLAHLLRNANTLTNWTRSRTGHEGLSI